MSIRQMINSPDFKNIQLAIELNLFSKEIKELSDFYNANKGKSMNFYDFVGKFSRLRDRANIKIDVAFDDYGDFERFSERIASILGIKIYHFSGNNKNTVCKEWDTMDRLSLGLTIPQWMRYTNKTKIKHYKVSLPF